MLIKNVHPLMGPNIWLNRPVIEAWVDIGHFEDFPSNTLPGFNERLMRWLPSMVEHRCSIGERGGFFQRLESGTWLGHVLEHVTIELHALSHVSLGFGRARETRDRGVYKVVIECETPSFSENCLRVARELVLAAVEGREFDVTAELRKLAEIADALCLGPSTRAIVSAATRRDVPSIRITEGNLVQLGYGKGQRRIWTAETARTGAIAEAIAQDKELTSRLLRGVGVPVPEGRIAKDPDDAWAAASELGGPVVVKPQDANHGRGVSIRLEDQAAVTAAFHYAAKEGSGVVVERFIPGTQYRVLVVGERAVAASGGEADQLLADGTHSVDELVALANQDPKRGEDSAQVLTTIVLDEISLDLLRRQGLEPSSVPAAGRTVMIRYNGDLTVDVTDRMHTEVAQHCVLAAQTIGLDVAGIDLIAEDIGRPLERQGGAIIEVNASPGLVMHLKPLVGTPRPVGEAIIDHLFRKDEDGRVPVVAVSGTNGKSYVTSLLASMLTAAGRAVGRADSHGVVVRDRVLSANDAVNFTAARRVLMNPFVDAIVLEVSEEEVLRQGLPFDRCEVAVVTNVGSGDHMGAQYVDDLGVVTKAIRAPVDVVLPRGTAVLPASALADADLGERCKGRIALFGRAPESSPLREHIATGQLAVTLEGDQLVALRNGQREYLFDLARLSCAVLGLPPFLVDDLMAATTAALALGLAPSAVKAGLARAMGRDGIAVFEGASATAVATPCRNPSALAAWLQTLEVTFGSHQLHVIIELGSDVRPEDATALGELLGRRAASIGAVLPPTSPLSAAFREKCASTVSLELFPENAFSRAISEKVAHLGAHDLLFVVPATSEGQQAALSCLVEKGMSRRRVTGLASVEHCR